MEKIRILFVDDEPELVSAVVERLELRDIMATGAMDAVKALKKIDEMDFSVVILDVRMPGMGGLEMLRLLRRTHPELQVVLLTGHGSTEDVEEGTRLGAFEYLQKPVDIEHLVDIIRRASAAQAGGDRNE